MPVGSLGGTSVEWDPPGALLPIGGVWGLLPAWQLASVLLARRPPSLPLTLQTWKPVPTLCASSPPLEDAPSWLS